MTKKEKEPLVKGHSYEFSPLIFLNLEQLKCYTPQMTRGMGIRCFIFETRHCVRVPHTTKGSNKSNALYR